MAKREKLTSEEQKALEAFRALYSTNPQAITGDMGTALFRNLNAKTRDKIKSYFSADEKKAYNSFIKQYKALPADQQIGVGQTPKPSGPTPGQLGQTTGAPIDLSVPGAPENMNGIVSALTDPMLARQYEELRRWYADQDRFNRPNIYGPLGQTTYGYNPETGRVEQTTVADPAQQRLLSEETARDEQAARIAQGYLDRVGQSAGNDYASDRAAATNAVYQQWLKVNEPAMQRQMQEFEQNMANRGIVPGSEQYNREKDLLMKSQQDQRDAALVSAQSQGREEQLHALNVSQDQPTRIAQQLLAMGKGPQLPEAPTPTNLDTNYLNSLDTAFKGIEQTLNSDQFRAKLEQDATELARRYNLDKYQVYEGLKLQYKQLLTQQAIAQINANAQLGAAGIGANATITASRINAESDERINQQNIDADRDAWNAQQGQDGGNSVADDVGQGVVDGITGGVSPTAGAKSAKVQPLRYNPTAQGSIGQISILPTQNRPQTSAPIRQTPTGFGAGSSVFSGRKNRIFG